MMLHRLRDASGFERFRAAVINSGSLAPDAAYLTGAAVYVIGRVADPIGGFVIATDPPFRSLQFLPPGAIQESTPRGPLGARVAEITCVWMSPRTSGLAWRSLLWAAVVVCALASGSRHFLAYSRKPGLLPIYESCQPTVLWRGGDSSLLLLIPRWVLIAALLRYPRTRAEMAARRRARLRAPDT